jgi:hypothetical protein
MRALTISLASFEKGYEDKVGALFYSPDLGLYIAKKNALQLEGVFFRLKINH